MSWNGSGTFNRQFSWVADKNAGLNISSSRMDTDTNDITSNGFNNTLTRDGQGSAAAVLPMNSFRHTGVGAATARTDYARLDQVQDGVTLNWTTAGGSADALTATYTPALTALVDGQLCCVRAAAANATSAPTFAPNGLTARVITKLGGAALSAGDIPGNLAEVILRYKLANTRWELLNPANGLPVGAVIPYVGGLSAPIGFLLTDGSNVSRTTHAALFSVLGTAFGAGDGSTTFGLPDFRGRTAAGYDAGAVTGRLTGASGINSSVLGAAGGLQVVALATGELPTHTHTFAGTSGFSNSSLDHTHNFVASVSNSPASGGAGSLGANATSSTTGANNTSLDHQHNFSGTTAGAGSGTAHQNVQPTIVALYIIKT